ncbi:MAG: hypothetical protein ACRED5_15750 [Propylenella sp.]
MSMLRWPGPETRENVRFVSDVLQAFAIIFTIVWAATTFRHQVLTEAEATRRELSRPYAEKQLDLYLDAARVVAHLAAAAPDSPDRAATETRFWELYWGELAFVESRTRDEAAGGPPSVERLMVEFCNQHFAPQKCNSSAGPGLPAAINLARQASDEVRRRWEDIGRPVDR